MYSAGAFWSMARHQTAVLAIVWNNRNYQTVRNGAFRYNKRLTATDQFRGLYLGVPDIDFVKLAESQGVKGQRVTGASEIAAVLKKGDLPAFVGPVSTGDSPTALTVSGAGLHPYDSGHVAPLASIPTFDRRSASLFCSRGTCSNLTLPICMTSIFAWRWRGLRPSFFTL